MPASSAAPAQDRTLANKLARCEQDLQTHAGRVSALEGALEDVTRQRDDAAAQVERLERALADAQREVAAVRQSGAAETQALQSQLDEERRTRERARELLESRMAELQKRKSNWSWF
jgi:chromosome segregation ATPase